MLTDFTKIEFDIIIAAGQSNCEGSGIGDVEVPYEPKENVWYLNRNSTISTAGEKINGNFLLGAFPLIFADEYIKGGYLKSGRHILIVDSAVGGTGFVKGHHEHTWSKGGELSQCMFRLTSDALALNPNNKVVAFLWHQGENSVSFNTTPDEHFNYMHELLSDVTAQIKGNYPIVLGDFVQAWKQEIGKRADEIANANRKAAKAFNGFFVETKGLLSNAEIVPQGHIKCEDTIHFSREALYSLGKRYFEEFKVYTSKLA